MSARITYREAVRLAMDEALTRDPRVILMGVDVGAYGGYYAASKGLLAKWGPERVRDMPLSELTNTGAAVGAAIAGARPILDLMTVNFSLLALDQIVNTAATFLHMSGGQFNVPLVIRIAYGGGTQMAAQHSHALEGYFAHIPGITVAAPATIADARGMLWTALQQPDPVVLFEHALLYNTEEELPEGAGAVDLERAAVRRPGRDLTLVTWGGMLPRTLAAAEELAKAGVDAEVLDLRVLRPLDPETLRGSIARTRRAVIVDEEWRAGGFAAEVMARIVEGSFYDLDAPPARVCSAEVPMPYPKHLEEVVLPQVSTIASAALALCGRHG